MAREKHELAGKLKNKQRKINALLLSIALLLALSAGGTLAYIVTKSAMAANQFEKGYVTSSVNDNGQVTNYGNVDAYIRAAVVVNWMDESGNVYGLRPRCNLTVNSGWSESETDGFFYYTSAVASGQTTTTSPVTVDLLESESAPSDVYSLSIEIVAEAIQAEGYTDIGNVPAYQNAWGISSIGN